MVNPPKDFKTLKFIQKLYIKNLIIELYTINYFKHNFSYKSNLGNIKKLCYYIKNRKYFKTTE